MRKEGTNEATAPVRSDRWRVILLNTTYIVGALFVFLLALDLMISSLQHLGAGAVETIIMATSNPFTGLFIGLLVTAIIQSSSATTSMVVALVTSGSISLQGAVPIIMGANVGTTITSTIISLGFITKKKEFRRALAAGTYHDFFNILTVLLLFPLEYYIGFLSGISQYLADTFFEQPVAATSKISLLGTGLGSMINKLVTTVDNGFVLILLSFALLFGSILFFRKVISDMLGLRTQARVQFFFQSPVKSLGWGLLITAAIRSSTITTSLVVPLVAKRIVKLRAAVPFILGANIGTTVTAFIAAMSNSNIAISIAFAHFLFNFIGVAIFFRTPYVKEVPVNLARGLGRLTIKYRLAGFVYILLTFFFIPFSLIYLNKNAVSIRELTYRAGSREGPESQYVIISKSLRNQPLTSWMVYDRPAESSDPTQMISVYRTQNLLMMNNEVFELNSPGFCREGEDRTGKYRMCILDVLPHFRLNESVEADSVYIFKKLYTGRHSTHSSTLFISSTENLLLKKELRSRDSTLLEVHELMQIVEK